MTQVMMFTGEFFLEQPGRNARLSEMKRQRNIPLFNEDDGAAPVLKVVRTATFPPIRLLGKQYEGAALPPDVPLSFPGAEFPERCGKSWNPVYSV